MPEYQRKSKRPLQPKQEPGFTITQVVGFVPLGPDGVPPLEAAMAAIAQRIDITGVSEMVEAFEFTIPGGLHYEIEVTAS